MCVYNVYVLCAYVFVYMPVSRTSLLTRSTVLRRTLSAAAVRSLGFSKNIFKFPLFFSFKKLLTLITTFFKSDDVAFPFGILTACGTRCH